MIVINVQVTGGELVKKVYFAKKKLYDIINKYTMCNGSFVGHRFDYRAINIHCQL